MGNRGLEQRGKKARTYPPKETAANPQKVVQVAALEVQNVKRAINRYGTLPKGARIGAYLESLRQSGLSTNQEPTSNVPITCPEQPTDTTVRSLSPRTNIRTQPQMIRSNSSSGVTTFHHPNQPPSSPTAIKLRPRTGVSRNNSTEVGLSLRTFRSVTNSSFRGGSPSRALQPSLADLEFPPPPTDLPPPPEEFDNEINDMPSLSSFKRPLDTAEDVSNTQPSVEEASSRFGISLRHREPSIDSCGSGKDRAASPITPGQDESPVSDAPAVGSPLDPLPSPPVFPEPNDEIPEVDNPPNNDDENKNNSKIFKTPLPGMKEMLELKLVAEIKERADQKTKNVKDLSPKDRLPTSIGQDPVAQLVSELSESLNLDAIRKDSSDSKVNLRKTSQSTLPPKSESTSTFKPQLKKVEPRNNVPKEDSNAIIDFKSRLRKVDSGGSDKKPETEEEEPIKEIEPRRNSVGADGADQPANETTKRESTASAHSLDSSLKVDETDDKRRSTGSISSLKKLWESKETSETGLIQLSPKLSIKNKVDAQRTPKEESEATDGSVSDNVPTEDSPEDSSMSKSLTGVKITGSSERRVWPPSDEKPVVPVKPVVKAVKPVLATGNRIYATPIAPKPPVSTKPVLDNKPTAEDNDNKSTTEKTDKTGRDNILEISQALESSLSSVRASQTVTSATWLQLSDKLGLLHSSCAGYADVAVLPAHAKFHFRELLTRLEAQAQRLRSAGGRNVSDNTRLLADVSNAVKDVVNAVTR